MKTSSSSHALNAEANSQSRLLTSKSLSAGSLRVGKSPDGSAGRRSGSRNGNFHTSSGVDEELKPLLDLTGFTAACAAAEARAGHTHEFCCLGDWHCRRYRSPTDHTARVSDESGGRRTRSEAGAWQGAGRRAWWVTLAHESVEMQTDGQIWEADKHAGAGAGAIWSPLAASSAREFNDCALLPSRA